MTSRAIDTLRSPLALMLFFGTTLTGLALDLWTKALAVDHLASGHVARVLPGLLHFTYTENRGAVFGMGQGQRWLFVAVSLAAIAFLTYLFALSDGRRFYQFLLGMLLAGVLGNMYDRVVYGYVRDMILALPDWDWPEGIARFLPARMPRQVFPWVFNVADSLLCMGVFLMIVYSFIHRPDEETGLQAQPDTDRQP